MNKSIRRVLRTAIQVGLPGALIAMLAAFAIIDWTTEQTAAVMAVLTIAASWGQNSIEDATGTDLLIARTPPGEAE
jgi:hypothetical protein